MTPADPSLPTTDPIQDRLGRYQLLRLLGEGGMGQVYLAQDEQLDRHVAVKVLPAGKINDAEAVTRFTREARALAQLAHPGIVQAFDSGEHGGRHFLVMEHVEGRSLSAVLREGRLPPSRAADYAHQAALALHHAHQRGLIHRDVKPSNLFVTASGQVKLLDLGLARFLQDQIGDDATREGVGLGTPDYAAPEQFRDAHGVDPRADVYSLGCTLYHLLAGRVPFPTSSLREKCEAHERQTPTPLEELCPEAPGGLVLAVERMMAKRPADRFASAAEAAEALAPFVAGSSLSFQTLRNTGSWHRGQLTMTSLPRRRRWPAAMVVAALLLVLLGAGLSAFLLRNRGAGQGDGALARGNGQPQENEQPADKPEGAKNDKEKEPPKDPSAPDDAANVLTVARNGKAKYGTIGEALEKVKPGQTIRIVDDLVYAERVEFEDEARFRDVTLEATRGAILEVEPSPLATLSLRHVTGLRVRGLRFRVKKGPGRACAVRVQGKCSGVELEDLHFEGTNGMMLGLEISDLESTSDVGPPALTVRSCTFRRCIVGAVFSGISVGPNEYGPLTPIASVLVEGNTFVDGQLALGMKGQLKHVQVVANRFLGQQTCAIHLERIDAKSRQVLVANNTLQDCAAALWSWDTAPRTDQVRIVNNLVLGKSQLDFVAIQSNSPSQPNGFGDGPAYAKKWHFSHNWREGKEPAHTKGWIPPGKTDVHRAAFDEVVREGDLVRPKPSSDAAKAGAGTTDPSLPSYVGALPPEGTSAWDWSRTYHVPPPGELITVSKRKEDKADHDTLSGALEAAKPNVTIRVLDDAVYRESLLLNRNERFAGVRLEATGGATLEATAEFPILLTLKDVQGVSVRGLRFRTKGGRAISPAVLLDGECGEVELASLTFEGTGQGNMVGVGLAGPTVSVSARPVLTVRDCAFRGLLMGVYLQGALAAGEVFGRDTPVRGVLLAGNVFSDCVWSVKVRGHLEQVLIVGNRIIKAKMSGGIRTRHRRHQAAPAGEQYLRGVQLRGSLLGGQAAQ